MFRIVTAISFVTLLALCLVHMGNTTPLKKKNAKSWHRLVIVVKVTHYKPHNPTTAFGKKPNERIVAFNHWKTVPKGATVRLIDVKENGRWRKIHTINKAYVYDKTARSLWDDQAHIVDYCEPTGIPRPMVAAVNAKDCHAELLWHD